MFHRRLGVGLILILYCMTSELSADTGRLLEYDCVVVIGDQAGAQVTASATVAGATQDSGWILVRRDSHVQIEDIVLSDQHKTVVTPQIAYLPSGLRLKLGRDSPNSWKLQYKVESEAGPLSRVPLPIPSALPGQGLDPIHITLRLPAGQSVYGDLLPELTWNSPVEGSATLPSVPSLLIFHSKATAAITARERVLTSSNIATVSMLFLLTSGILFLSLRLARRRRAQNAMEV